VNIEGTLIHATMSDASERLVSAEIETISQSLESHKDLLPFITVELIRDESQHTLQNAGHAATLKMFQELCSQALVLRNAPYASKVLHIPRRPFVSRLAYHQARFLEGKISRKVFRQYNQRVQCILRLWVWLKKLQLHTVHSALNGSKLRTI
jgi:hypothetical protein